MNLQDIKDFIERPKLTMIDEQYQFPHEFLWLKPFINKVLFTGKTSKYKQQYWKWMLLSDDAKTHEGSYFTPQLITNFVNDYIDQIGFTFTSICDFTAGVGSFIFAIKNINNKHIELWDINKKSLAIAKEIAKQLKINGHLVFKTDDTMKWADRQNQLGLFDYDQHPQQKFKLLVINPPFNMHKESNFNFIDLALDFLGVNGKAFIILPNGVLNNVFEVSKRKILINKGLLEAVVYFPDKLFENTSIPSCMLILSKRKTAWLNVKFYDLRNLRLPIVRKSTKVNPLSGRVYYRDVPNYSLWKLKINRFQSPLISNCQEQNYSLNLNNYLPVAIIGCSKNFWWDNLQIINSWNWGNKDHNNWFVLACTKGPQFVINKLNKLLKLERNKHINTKELYKQAIKNPHVIQDQEFMTLIEKMKVPKQFFIDCAYIKNLLIHLLVA